jgi:hypothetical protein
MDRLDQMSIEARGLEGVPPPQGGGQRERPHRAGRGGRPAGPEQAGKTTTFMVVGLLNPDRAHPLDG